MSEGSGTAEHISPGLDARDTSITFCLLTLNRVPWVKRSILSIRDYCPTRHSITVLSQGQPELELTEFLANLDEDVELITSPVNLGPGKGRKTLTETVTSPLTMILDDDIYLTEGAINHALKVLDENERIGAVAMPQYDLQGRLLSPGGKIWIIRNGVIHAQIPRLNFQVDYLQLEFLDAGAMLYRTEMRNSFSWENRDFEDEDNALSILKEGRWKQAIVPNARLVHDRTWVRHKRDYERQRLDGLSWRRSYRSFRAKWGLRFDLRVHVMYELVWPALTLSRCQWLMSDLEEFIQVRKLHRLRRQNESELRRRNPGSNQP